VSVARWASRVRPSVEHADGDGEDAAKCEHLDTCRALALRINTAERVSPTRSTVDRSIEAERSCAFVGRSLSSD